MAINIYQTQTMLAAIELMTPRNTFLRDRYFPTTENDIFVTEDVLVEYKDELKKKLAPCVVPYKGGIPMSRSGYKTERFTPPNVAASRVLSITDLMKKQFGETLFSQQQPAQTLLNNGYTLKHYADKYGGDKYEEFGITFYDELTNPAIAEAKNWKKNNGYTSERSKVYWPKAKDNVGHVYNLSTLAVVEFMRADYSHNSVPMETCGNKKVAMVEQYFGADSKNRGFDQVTSKDLTSNGISTIVFWGGNWVLWGDHTAAYAYGADVDPRCIFDVSMRMLFHITNSFQREWGVVIDTKVRQQPAGVDRSLLCPVYSLTRTSLKPHIYEKRAYMPQMESMKY